MAQEAKRGCGFRRVGDLYLVGGFFAVQCDRLPYPLDICPVCGGGIKVSRAFTRVNPLALFGDHQDCVDQHRPCRLCDPTSHIAFIMRVGEKFYPTPGHFADEAMAMGISKKIPFIPKELELGETHIFLAHPKACEVRVPAVLQAVGAIADQGPTPQPRLLEAETIEYKMGIFTAFTPKGIEQLVWKNQTTPKDLEHLAKRGITAVVIEDGDLDHAR